MLSTINVIHSIYSILLLNDSFLFVGTDDYPFITIWSIKSKSQVKQFIGHTGIIWTLEKLTDEILASGSADKSIKICNYTQSRLVKNLTGHTDSVEDLLVLDN